MVGEPWRFGLSTSPPSRARAEEFLQSCGLREPYGMESARHEPFRWFGGRGGPRLGQLSDLSDTAGREPVLGFGQW